MTEHSTGIRIQSASVTDRGLNERRPLNEDSMLADTEHDLYVVADGVGGAEAGEVASQTAIEDPRRSLRPTPSGETPKTLEIAIQRATTRSPAIFARATRSPRDGDDHRPLSTWTAARGHRQSATPHLHLTPDADAAARDRRPPLSSVRGSAGRSMTRAAAQPTNRAQVTGAR